MSCDFLRHRTSHPPHPRLHPRWIARTPILRVDAFRPRSVEPLARLALRARRGRPALWLGHLCADDLAAKCDGAFHELSLCTTHAESGFFDAFALRFHAERNSPGTRMLSAEFARLPWLCAALRPRVSGFMIRSRERIEACLRSI